MRTDSSDEGALFASALQATLPHFAGLYNSTWTGPIETTTSCYLGTQSTYRLLDILHHQTNCSIFGYLKMIASQ